MLLLDLRNQLSLDKYNWEDVHYYGTILDTNHKILDWNSGKMFTEPRSGEVNIPKATIHRDWKQ